MSGEQSQPSANSVAVEPYGAPGSAAEWGGGQEVAPVAPSGPKIGRYIAALRRFKWLIVAFVLVGAAGGYTATKFLTPEYEVDATIILQSGTSTGVGGAVQSGEFLRASGWQDLLRSSSIADPIVNELALFVEPKRLADSALFRGFHASESTRLRPGNYVLTVANGRYKLALASGIEMEAGALGDSIGSKIGFVWQPSRQSFAGKAEVPFNVMTPREKSQELINKLGIRYTDGSAFLFLRLTGPNNSLAAATLNAWVERFVATATALKKQKVSMYARILEGQRQYAATTLQEAEGALQQFRVSTVTLPSERANGITPGLEMTNSPVFSNYFNQKINAENIARDRASIERVLAEGKQAGTISREALLSIPIVSTDPAAGNLIRVLNEELDREASLRKVRESYTDATEQVRTERAALATLRTLTLPTAVVAFNEQLRLREQQLNATIEKSGRELGGIPARTIEEQRLKRAVAVAEEMYRTFDMKSQEATLAEAATVPDVSVQDSAVAPLSPTRNTAPVLILGAIGAALGAGVLLAILLDQTDKRFRYPEQVTDDLGLFVLGVVPIAGGTRRGKRAEDQASQVVEAFRSIRMNVRYAADPLRPFTMTITSPGPNDGKSLVASNLALSFAESGARTLLIDGDIRRGDLAKTFGSAPRPGLIEYLDGTALIAEVLHPTDSHRNLVLMPAGAKRKRAPELLATPRLSQLINQMGQEFDVVVVDSPPLGAGFDAYALATATGNMALVMRSGITDRKMAAAKMSIVDTLPVRVMGAILNGIEMTGVYQYYSYYQDYGATDEVEVARLPRAPEQEVGVSVNDE